MTSPKIRERRILSLDPHDIKHVTVDEARRSGTACAAIEALQRVARIPILWRTPKKYEPGTADASRVVSSLSFGLRDRKTGTVLSMPQVRRRISTEQTQYRRRISGGPRERDDAARSPDKNWKPYPCLLTLRELQELIAQQLG
ncbi:hypothetical protein [Rhizobium sp. BK538]|uniref:hypothetical protein n=1 Tax=Rhizobium sp. BK538 TaxID=2586984 RepID=UPI001608CB33|nr:hypothetical protein [Rhizobium sp. BK538]MBB4171078.1 hypothetical protein [Rhizobium sp. BK538]